MSLHASMERFLADMLGMDADAAGKGALGRTIAQVMRQEGIAEAKAYEKLCLSSPEARQRLIDAVVVGETWFFRDRGPFLYLGRHARNLCETGRLNILSAPCSSGEEPYSIVMTLLACGIASDAFYVDGVDVSATALEKARRACYGNSSFRGHLPEEIAPYFRETAHGRQVTKDVTRKVTFYRDNLVEDKSLEGRGPYGMIFCRNLLIYLTPDARRQVFKKLDDLLLPGGILFTGHTETIFWHRQGYIPMKWERAFALAKPVSPAAAEAGLLKPSPTAPSGRGNQKIADGCGPKAGVPQSGWKKAANACVKTGSTKAEELQQARQLADKGDMDAAIKLCQVRLGTAGPDADIYCLMGVIQMSRKNLPGAEDYFSKALYLNPGHYESLVHISLIYRQKGDKRKAALYLERAKRQIKKEETAIGSHG